MNMADTFQAYLRMVEVYLGRSKMNNILGNILAIKTQESEFL